MTVASPTQIALAWTGELATLPVLGLVLVLAVRSFRLPWNLWGGRKSADHDHEGDDWAKEPEGRFHCPMCSRSFSIMRTWDSHVRNEHGVSRAAFA
ncbi:MAG TPA: hypothetical protein VGV89_10140 [Thermoplasmata archaeon]|nr:hypothetical protein [Thermoplasmata archaeon]